MVKKKRWSGGSWSVLWQSQHVPKSVWGVIHSLRGSGPLLEWIRMCPHRKFSGSHLRGVFLRSRVRMIRHYLQPHTVWRTMRVVIGMHIQRMMYRFPIWHVIHSVIFLNILKNLWKVICILLRMIPHPTWIVGGKHVGEYIFKKKYLP